MELQESIDRISEAVFFSQLELFLQLLNLLSYGFGRPFWGVPLCKLVKGVSFPSFNMDNLILGVETLLVAKVVLKSTGFKGVDTRR